MGRLIDLDLAIDEINNLVCSMSVCCSKDEFYGMRNMHERVVDTLKNLQPKEPEIVHCKECKYYEYILYQYSQFEYGECAMRDACSVNPDDFCSKGERKTNGTTTT